MYANVVSVGLNGLMGYLSCVEVDVTKTMPGFDMVGSLSKEVKEAKERVRVALKNSEIDVGPVRITVNISPAEIRKEGTAYDLPIAIGIMVALGYIPDECLDNMCILGELGLNGEIKQVKGILPMVLTARQNGIKQCIIPAGNYNEVKNIPGIHLIGMHSFSGLYEWLTTGRKIKENDVSVINDDKQTKKEKTEDFKDVKGQEAGKKVAMIATAGFHHLLLMGPPGSGKTMIAKRLSGIMPPMDEEEMLEISTIYSVCGKLSGENPFVTKRPFVAPHHTVPVTTLIGGGVVPKPGLISMSHKGILFLDELPEYSRDSIEALRQPLEEKKITIVRNRGSYEFPCDFMMVGSCNLCPCGYYPNREKCKCTQQDIVRYMNKISGPIRDRIDLCIVADKIDIAELTEKRETLDTKTMQKRVVEARKIQKKRFEGTNIGYNGNIPVGSVEKYCYLGKEEKEYVQTLFPAMQLSARSYHKVLRVARTIADLEGDEMISVSHLAQAVCYRMQEGGKE